VADQRHSLLTAAWSNCSSLACAIATCAFGAARDFRGSHENRRNVCIKQPGLPSRIATYPSFSCTRPPTRSLLPFPSRQFQPRTYRGCDTRGNAARFECQWFFLLAIAMYCPTHSRLQFLLAPPTAPSVITTALVARSSVHSTTLHSPPAKPGGSEMKRHSMTICRRCLTCRR